jgi:hypothetical protein
MRSVPCLILSLAIAGVAQAADPMWSPFVAVGYAPSVTNVDHADYTDKGAISLGLGASMKQPLYDYCGYTVAVEVFDTYGKADGDQSSVSGVEVKTNDLGLKVAAGPIHDFTPNLSLALLPYIGVAWARFDYSGGGASETDNGIALVYGAKLALHYALDHGLRVGIYGGIEGSTTREKSKVADVKYTATGLGPVAGLSFGWLF